MKLRLVLFFGVFVFLLAGCGKQASFSEQGETAETDVFLSSAETQDVLSEESCDGAGDLHNHFWQEQSKTQATCSENGFCIYACACGETKEEVLHHVSHEYVLQGCGNRLLCEKCGAEGDLSPHQFDGNVCKICKLTVHSPIFVQNVQLDFDESQESVLKKMGQPTEVLTEGELKSFVYASDLTELTVIQTDQMGLWGIFTLDPDAFFYIDGKIVKADDFSGKADKNSEATYREFGACRVYAFCDGLGTKTNYGMWLRYAECDYHYLTDPNISQNYDAQSRLSYYYVNALRALNGLEHLEWSDAAAELSTEYAVKMAEEDFFNHDNLLEKRLNDAEIQWDFSGENISQGYVNSFFVCDAYYNCIDHRNNILNPDFTHVGMGFARKTKDGDPVTVLGAQTFFVQKKMQ